MRQKKGASHLPKPGAPMSVALAKWHRDLYPDATASELIDCCVHLLGSIHKLHREENEELLRAQTILEGVASRH